MLPHHLYGERYMSSLLDALETIRPEVDFTNSEDFIKEGILDSFDIITLVAEMEKRFGITIDGEDVTPENFKNIETLEQFVQRYLSKES